MSRPRHPKHAELVDAAVELRRAGWTATRIAAHLGVSPRCQVIREAACRVKAEGSAPRARAKASLRQRAIELRMEGSTSAEIMQTLGVAKSTVYLWLRDLCLTPEAREALLERRRARVLESATGKSRVARERDEWWVERADEWLGYLSARELTLLACLAYWCEGTKSKPWRAKRRVVFINSDPGLIVIFLSWLRSAGVAADRIGFRLSIHESADVIAATEYWAEVVRVPPAIFRPPTLKRHRATTVRRNVESEYVGCLIVDVARSADLYRLIRGVVAAVSDQLIEQQPAASDMPEGTPRSSPLITEPP